MKNILKNFPSFVPAVSTPRLRPVESVSVINADARPPVQRSIVGHAVVNLDRARGNLSARRSFLDAEIARMTEELRQVNAAFNSLSIALTELGSDPALTDDERAMADGPLNEALSDQDIDLSDDAESVK